MCVWGGLPAVNTVKSTWGLNNPCGPGKELHLMHRRQPWDQPEAWAEDISKCLVGIGVGVAEHATRKRLHAPLHQARFSRLIFWAGRSFTLGKPFPVRRTTGARTAGPKPTPRGLLPAFGIIHPRAHRPMLFQKGGSTATTEAPIKAELLEKLQGTGVCSQLTSRSQLRPRTRHGTVKRLRCEPFPRPHRSHQVEAEGRTLIHKGKCK